MGWRRLACAGRSTLVEVRSMYGSGLLNCGRVTCVSFGLAVAAASLSAQATAPGTAAYRLDYARNFFASPAAELADRRIVAARVDSLSHLIPRMNRSAAALESALRRMDRISADEERHDTYLKLRVADSTLDDASRQARNQLSGRIDPVLEAVNQHLATLDSATVGRFVRQRPALARFRFAVAEARRGRHSGVSPGVDSMLATLQPAVTDWQNDLYERLLARTRWGTVQTGQGEADVFQQSRALRTDPDSSVRAEARRKLDQGYLAQRDLYAFSLLQTVRARNAMARARGYSDAPAEVYTSRRLDPASVRDLIRRVRQRGELAKRFARDQRAAPSAAGPALSLDSAAAIIRAGLAPLGAGYGRELTALLDPANGRLDIGPGPLRQATGFSWENPGVATGVYLYWFDGRAGDISRLTHEAGHAMHRRLMTLGAVPRVYTGGPLLAEPVAQFNELLVMDYLARTSPDTATRIAALTKFLDVALDAAYGAQDADLEQQVYDSVAADVVHTADDLDRISARVDSAYDIPLDGDAAGHRWMQVRLMWEDPLYLSNYMYSGMIALACFARFSSDSARFVPAYLSLLKEGWPAPAQQLLRQHLGINVDDPALVPETFTLIERRLTQLERLQREF